MPSRTSINSTLHHYRSAYPAKGHRVLAWAWVSSSGSGSAWHYEYDKCYVPTPKKSGHRNIDHPTPNAGTKRGNIAARNINSSEMGACKTQQSESNAVSCARCWQATTTSSQTNLTAQTVLKHLQCLRLLLKKTACPKIILLIWTSAEIWHLLDNIHSRMFLFLLDKLQAFIPKTVLIFCIAVCIT